MPKTIPQAIISGLATKISRTIEVCGVLSAIEELQQKFGYDQISAIEQLIAFGRDVPGFGGKKINRYLHI
jgi:DNA polymerase/3'-5' exonuclease PolX